MKYLIRSLKWTKHYKKETWYRPNSNGYTHDIYFAGIYTDADIARMNGVISEKVIQFIPLSEKLKQKGIKQLKQHIKEYQFDIDRANHIVNDSKEQIEIVKLQIDSFDKSFNA